MKINIVSLTAKFGMNDEHLTLNLNNKSDRIEETSHGRKTVVGRVQKVIRIRSTLVFQNELIVTHPTIRCAVSYTHLTLPTILRV